MSKFVKLSRTEMKNVKGGLFDPIGTLNCTNDCGGTAGSCPEGKTCKLSQACPDDPKFEHNICS